MVSVGSCDGFSVGESVGSGVGTSGPMFGSGLVGSRVGLFVGSTVGAVEGFGVRCAPGLDRGKSNNSSLGATSFCFDTTL